MFNFTIVVFDGTSPTFYSYYESHITEMRVLRDMTRGISPEILSEQATCTFDTAYEQHAYSLHSHL